MQQLAEAGLHALADLAGDGGHEARARKKAKRPGQKVHTLHGAVSEVRFWLVV